MKKICSKCKLAKPTSEFQKDKSRKDGLYPVCKPCRSLLTKASYDKNRESVRAKQKAKYWGNPEKARATSKAFREQNPEYMRGYLRGYYQANRDTMLANMKATYWADPQAARAKRSKWANANREKVRESIRDYFRRNPHVVALNATKYRMRLSKAENTLTPEQMAETLEYFGYRCGYCLVDLRTLPKGQRTIDHMLPLIRGGANSQDNVIPCCKSCNSRKRDRHMGLMARYIDMTPLPFIPAGL
jgi:5-methylcytosine-specific restriction endonuclease McrA